VGDHVPVFVADGAGLGRVPAFQGELRQGRRVLPVAVQIDRFFDAIARVPFSCWKRSAARKRTIFWAVSAPIMRATSSPLSGSGVAWTSSPSIVRPLG